MSHIRTFDEINDIHKDVWETLRSTRIPLVLYGMGDGADKILKVFEDKGIKISGIFASDEFVRYKKFHDFTVVRYSDICKEFSDFAVVVAFASQRPEVLENIYRIASERTAYAPDVPVFGGGLFELAYFRENKERLRKVYDRLSDDVSKNTFVCSILYKLTGKIGYLRECTSDKEETNKFIYSFLNNRNYADIGAYNGDTVEEYVNAHGKKAKIYAFEPDGRNYRKLCEKSRALSENISCFNAAAWDKNETVYFSSRSGRASSAENAALFEKSKEIPAVRADSVIDAAVGFVKIDAEGSDKRALLGLSEVIKRDSPVIRCAAYHRTEDYFDIPETVLSVCPDYKIYMRHLEYVPGWDTDFIFAP